MLTGLKKKGNYEFRPVKLHLKIDFVLHPVRREGLAEQKDKQTNEKKSINILTKFFCLHI